MSASKKYNKLRYFLKKKLIFLRECRKQITLRKLWREVRFWFLIRFYQTENFFRKLINKPLEKKFDFVIDTNVKCDVLSIHDIDTLYDDITVPDNHVELIFRRHKARKALLLMWFFHKNSAKTYSLINEILKTLRTKADPSNTDFKTLYVTMMIHVFLYQLNWLDFTEVDMNNTGNLADDDLVIVAKRFGCSLITYEGFDKNANHNDNHGIRKRCRSVDVPVYSPDEFLKLHNIIENEFSNEIMLYLNTCIKTYAKENNITLPQENLSTLCGTIWHILSGWMPSGPNVQVIIK